MPTDLEMRFLSNLIHGMNIGELRGLVMHVAEREFEVVGAEALRIKEDRGRQSIRHLPEAEPNEVALASDLQSYTLSDDQPEDDSDYETPLAGPSIPPRRAPPPPIQTASTSVTSTQQRSKAERMHDLLNGSRTRSQRESLTRIAGIIDTFNWKRGNRSDFLNCYIGNSTALRKTYPAQGWPSMVGAHGDRLRRYSSDFEVMYPKKERPRRSEMDVGTTQMGEEVIKRKRKSKGKGKDKRNVKTEV